MNDTELHYHRLRAYTDTPMLRAAQAVEVAAMGIDVSHHQEEVNFQAAKENGIKFAAIRALYGLSPDDKFIQHWQASKGTMPRSAYLYYLDIQDPIAQAVALYNRCEQAGDFGELPPTLDVENYANATLTASKIQACANKLTDLFDVPPTIYTGFFVWRDSVLGNKDWAINHPLHIAYYPLAGWKPDYPQQVLAFPPLIPDPWESFSLWQWTSSAPAVQFGVSGTYLDLDYDSPEFHDKYFPPPEIIKEVTPTITATHKLIKNVLVYHGGSADWTFGLNAGELVEVRPTTPVNGRVHIVAIHPRGGIVFGWIPEIALEKLPEPVTVRAIWQTP